MQGLTVQWGILHITTKHGTYNKSALLLSRSCNFMLPTNPPIKSQGCTYTLVGVPFQPDFGVWFGFLSKGCKAWFENVKNFENEENLLAICLSS